MSTSAPHDHDDVSDDVPPVLPDDLPDDEARARILRRVQAGIARDRGRRRAVVAVVAFVAVLVVSFTALCLAHDATARHDHSDDGAGDEGRVALADPTPPSDPHRGRFVAGT